MMVIQMPTRQVANANTEPTPAALRPMASLISKSEKAMQKLAPGTWQHTMLGNNIKALHVAFSLLSGRTVKTTPDELLEAMSALADMARRTEESQAKFLPGTAQHTLQRNRLHALRLAEARTKLALERSKGKT